MRKPLLKAALVLAACLSAGALPAAAETGVTPDTIRIGMFGPLTGPTAVGSLPLFGAASVYKDVNDHGGIHGRKIELYIEDDACDPNKTISATKKLIAQDEVFMIHGGWCSGTVMAIKPELARNPGLPYMVLGAASAAISTPVMPNLFHPIATTQTVTRTMLDFALSKPDAQRIAIISHSDEWGKSHINPLLEYMKSKGMEPVESVWLERGSTSATSQLLKIRSAKPDVVLAILYPPELTLYLRGADKYGIKAPTVTTQGVSIEDMVHRVGNHEATKDLFVFYPLSGTLDAPAFGKWVDMYRKYYPNEPVETLSFMGMTGALAIVEALKRAGPDLTREKVIAELNQLKDFDPGLQSGPLTFTPEVHAGISSGKMIYWPKDRAEIVATYPAKQ
ncbi:ABC transporter substrate-binding protein [Castellaniella sp. S9]|uniref:ABC transporter substrate-binding protein n=1 Tax=Castellaniella sp. S9 TaxID=2993652 RepID=UPI0022B47640|nr:ABC transporter substrate-binding protein [Castellaniella sp. S9]